MNNQFRINIPNYQKHTETDGVLDLSRRDSVESPYNTPSPTHTAHSINSEPSPSGSNQSALPNVDHSKFASHFLAPSASNYISTSTSGQIYQFPYYSGNQVDFNYEPKREIISPSAMPMIDNNIPNFVMNAVAFQQQIAQSQLAAQVQQESPVSSPTSSPIETASAESTNYPMIMGRDGKLARPFKAYPRDPLSISAGFTTSEAIDAQSTRDYGSFRKRMLIDILKSNGGTPTISNPKMRRFSKKSSSKSSASMSLESSQNTLALDAESDANDSGSVDNEGTVRDAAYYERRLKNNAAAKKSRDRRRVKEDEIAIRAAFLERENLELKVKLAAAYRQLEMMGIM